MRVWKLDKKSQVFWNLVAEITQLSIAVWGIAVGIIVMNDSYGIGDFKAWAFEDSTWVRPKPV